MKSYKNLRKQGLLVGTKAPSFRDGMRGVNVYIAGCVFPLNEQVLYSCRIPERIRSYQELCTKPTVQLNFQFFSTL